MRFLVLLMVILAACTPTRAQTPAPKEPPPKVPEFAAEFKQLMGEAVAVSNAHYYDTVRLGTAMRKCEDRECVVQAYRVWATSLESLVAARNMSLHAMDLLGANCIGSKHKQLCAEAVAYNNELGDVPVQLQSQITSSNEIKETLERVLHPKPVNTKRRDL